VDSSGIDSIIFARVSGELAPPPPVWKIEICTAAACSRVARSGAIRAGLGVGMREVKRHEKLRIWRPEVVSRAGVPRAAWEIPGAGEVGAAGSQISSFS